MLDSDVNLITLTLSCGLGKLVSGILSGGRVRTPSAKKGVTKVVSKSSIASTEKENGVSAKIKGKLHYFACGVCDAEGIGRLRSTIFTAATTAQESC